jgi:AcrR family transcriptional regulator
MSARPASKSAYHHGDLGNAALAEVLLVLAERGARGVTFAEVARRLGVTAAALYRHYADPEALLIAAATESFVLFDRSLRAVAAGAPYERLHGMTNAYLAFASKQPARYELMFNTRIDCRKPKALLDAGAGAFGALVEALAACRPQATPAHLNDLAKQVWALCHGFASLADAERMAVAKREAQTLLWQAVRLIVEGA